MEVTKEDLNRLYDKMEPMAQDIAEIKTRLNMMPQPEKRPCMFFTVLEKAFNEHLDQHNVNIRDWKMVAIELGSSAVKWIAVIAAAYFIGKGRL